MRQKRLTMRSISTGLVVAGLALVFLGGTCTVKAQSSDPSEPLLLRDLDEAYPSALSACAMKFGNAVPWSCYSVPGVNTPRAAYLTFLARLRMRSDVAHVTPEPGTPAIDLVSRGYSFTFTFVRSAANPSKIIAEVTYITTQAGLRARLCTGPDALFRLPDEFFGTDARPLNVVLACYSNQIDITDRYGQTPLIYAVNKDREDIVRALLNAGANPNHETLAGWTPILYAARGSGPAIVRDLISAGADAKYVAPDGTSVATLVDQNPKLSSSDFAGGPMAGTGGSVTVPAGNRAVAVSTSPDVGDSAAARKESPTVLIFLTVVVVVLIAFGAIVLQQRMGAHPPTPSSVPLVDSMPATANLAERQPTTSTQSYVVETASRPASELLVGLQRDTPPIDEHVGAAMTMPSTKAVCPSCGSGYVQKVSMVVDLGTTTARLQGTAAGAAFTSEGVVPTLQQVSGTSTSMTALARRLQPPRTDHAKGAGAMVKFGAITAVVGGILFAAIPKPTEDPGVALILVAALCAGLVGVVLAVVGAIMLPGAKAKDMVNAPLREKWSRQWLCQACGHVWER